MIDRLVAKVIAGAITGFVAGWLAGAVLLRLLFDATGAATGWEDLVGLAAALFSFAPVGALVGGLLGARSRVGPWWRRIGPGARRATQTGGVLAASVGIAAAPWVGVETAVPAAVAAAPLGAGLGLLWERRIRTRAPGR